MKDVVSLTAAQLLAIPPEQPRKLFTWNAAAAKAEYRRLAARWHPDRNPGSTQAEFVFKHVNALYTAAQARLGAVPLLREIRGGGRTLRLWHLAARPFELGEMLIARNSVAFLVQPDCADLFDAARRTIAGLRYADDAMRADIARSVPIVEKIFEGDDALVLVVRRTPELVLLRDLAAHLGGRIEPRHVAWIGSTLLNLCCYLRWAGLTHNAITPDTWFVSPEHHGGVLLGGWWYTAPAGGSLIGLPRRAYDAAPPDLVGAKRADPRLDLELVRSICRELLGDPAGVRLRANPEIPRPMAEWLTLPTAGDAVEDYAAWRRVLTDSFGPRRFVELDASALDIYP